MTDFGNKVDPSNICRQFVHKLSENLDDFAYMKKILFSSLLQHLQLPLRYTVKKWDTEGIAWKVNGL